jgi:hypothetical protein
MSTVIDVGLLVKRREDAEKMAARAKELIEGTVPQEMKPFIELDFREADMNSLLWYDRHWGIGIGGVRKGCAEKALTDCFVDGCFVDIYPRYGNCRITKDMQLKDIKHIGGKLRDSFD